MTSSRAGCSSSLPHNCWRSSSTPASRLRRTMSRLSFSSKSFSATGVLLGCRPFFGRDDEAVGGEAVEEPAGLAIAALVEEHGAAHGQARAAHQPEHLAQREGVQVE